MEEGILHSGKAKNKALPILRTHLLWVEVYASEIHMLKSLLLIPKNVSLFRKKVIADVVKMKSHWRWAGPNPIRPVSHKERSLDTDIHTGRTACEDRGRIAGDTPSTSYRTPKIDSQTTRIEQRGIEWILPHGLQEEATLLTP